MTEPTMTARPNNLPLLMRRQALAGLAALPAADRAFALAEIEALQPLPAAVALDTAYNATIRWAEELVPDRFAGILQLGKGMADFSDLPNWDRVASHFRPGQAQVGRAGAQSTTERLALTFIEPSVILAEYLSYIKQVSSSWFLMNSLGAIILVMSVYMQNFDSIGRLVSIFHHLTQANAAFSSPLAACLQATLPVDQKVFFSNHEFRPLILPMRTDELAYTFGPGEQASSPMAAHGHCWAFAQSSRQQLERKLFMDTHPRTVPYHFDMPGKLNWLLDEIH